MLADVNWYFSNNIIRTMLIYSGVQLASCLTHILFVALSSSDEIDDVRCCTCETVSNLIGCVFLVHLKALLQIK